MLNRAIFKIGQYLRNPSISKWTKFLSESDRWSLQKLEAYQLKQLQEIIAFAYDNSVFYQKKIKEAGITPEDIKSLSDIKKLPVLTKEEVLNYNREIHTSHKFKKVFKATTSGSSGDALVFDREESADSFNRASIFRGYSWYGILPWDRNGYFWGFNFSTLSKVKTFFLDALQNRFRIFSYEERTFKKFVRKLERARFIHGYSSMIYQTAKFINERNLPKPNSIKMVKGTSEKIYDSYQEEVRKAFGQPMISEYGATESGIIAFECPEGNMHINMEGVLVETQNDEILVTNLQLKAFPIIRYQIGDYVKLAPKTEHCTCGRAHLIIEEVTGRVGNSVYGKQQIYPSLYFYYIFKNLGKEHDLKLTYHVVQRKKGELNFFIEETLTKEQELILVQEIEKYFKKDITFTIQDGIENPETKAKKKSFMSYI